MVYFEPCYGYSHFMAVTLESLKSLLENAFPEAEIRIEDVRGDGNHYAAYIEYSGFAGKSRVQQHQMVYQALGDAMRADLHALQIHTSIPSQ